AAARAPIRAQRRVPPCMREVAQCRRGNRRARLPRAEPSCDVLLRPEEIHNASGEDDVVPPVHCGYKAMEQQIGTVDRLLDDLDYIRLAAIGTRRLDSTVDLEGAENAECI